MCQIYSHAHTDKFITLYKHADIFTQSHDHGHYFTHAGKQIYALRCFHSGIQLMYILFTNRNMFTFAYKHIHTHQEAQTLIFTRYIHMLTFKYNHTLTFSHKYITHLLTEMNMLISIYMCTTIGILLNILLIYLLQYSNLVTFTHSNMYKFT